MSDKLAATTLGYWDTVGQRQYLRGIQVRNNLFKDNIRAEIVSKTVVGAKSGTGTGTEDDFIGDELDETDLNVILGNSSEKSCRYASCNEDALHSCVCGKTYCSPDHQKLDWENHQHMCRPYTYIELSNIGLVPVARFDLERDSVGRVILEDKQLVVLPQIPIIGESMVCIDCCRPILSTQFGKCRICFWPVCRDNCDETVSLHTQEECDILEVAKTSFHWKLPAGFELLWMIRILLKKKSNPQTYELLMNIQTREKYLKDYDVVPGRIYALEVLRRIYTFTENDFSNTELTHAWNLLRLKLLYSQMPTNAPMKKAKILYKEGGRFLHSCLANTGYETDASFNLRLYLQKPVKANEHLTINCDLESLFQPTRSRQIRFMCFYKFRCSCRRCEDPTELGTYFSGIPCHSTKECSNLKTPGFLLQKELTDPGSNWECYKCHHEELTNAVVQGWLYSITRGLEECLTRQAEPEELNLLVENIVRQQVLHESHYITFEYSVETLKLLEKQLQNDPSMGTTSRLMKYRQAARCVSKIFRTFLPTELNVIGPIFRMCALIKIAALVGGFQKKQYNLPRVRQDLERYVLKVDGGGKLGLRNGPLMLFQGKQYNQLDRDILLALVTEIEKYFSDLKKDENSVQIPIPTHSQVKVDDLIFYANYLRKHFSSEH